MNMQYQDIVNFDARLTEKGQAQCRELADRIRLASQDEDLALSQLRENVELVVTSPLTRCMQTALMSLEPVLGDDKPSVPPVVAHDGIRETVNYNCDRRRSVSELEKEFGDMVDFSFVEDEHDSIWHRYESSLGSDTDYTAHRESAEVHVVAQRARSFFVDFLAARPENHICLCSHRAFSRVLWNFGIGYSTNVQQVLDKRAEDVKENVPVVRYMGDDDFAASLRADYSNCELRAMVIAFR